MFWNGKKWPVRSRCSGIYVGELLGLFGLLAGISAGPWVSILAVPAVADWLLQRFAGIPGSNQRRLILGVPFGFSLVQFIACETVPTVTQHVLIRILADLCVFWIALYLLPIAGHVRGWFRARRGGCARTASRFGWRTMLLMGALAALLLELRWLLGQ